MLLSGFGISYTDPKFTAAEPGQGHSACARWSWQPNPITQPRSWEGSHSAGMLKGKINPFVQQCWHHRGDCWALWAWSSTDLGCDPLLTDAAIAALTTAAEGMARHQRHSEGLVFHRTICWSKHVPEKMTTFQLWALGYWKVFQW